MTSRDLWAVGVDLGGTKIEVARIDSEGRLHERLRRPTTVEQGPDSIKKEIVGLAQQLQELAGYPPVGIGIGIAGQIDPIDGNVIFAPNLYWRDVPLQSDLKQALELPVIVTNDVRAAAWGEWLYGAGAGCDDLVCLFVGTGIGGGVVSGGRMLTGCSNTAGELGHITIDVNGPLCTCGQKGCLEALAGGWAIGRIAQEAVALEPATGVQLIKLAEGRPDEITAKTVSKGFRAGDQLSIRIFEQFTRDLIAGAASIVNAFNPCRLILGGGVIDGFPQLIEQIDQGVRGRALPAATISLQVVQSKLGNDAGVVGAAVLALQTFQGEEPPNEL